MSCFSCCCQHFLKLASVFWSLTLMCLGVNFFGFILTEICCVSCVSFDRVGKISGTISFSALSSFSSLSEMLMTRTLRSLVTVLQDSEALFFFFSSLFFLVYFFFVVQVWLTSIVLFQFTYCFSFDPSFYYWIHGKVFSFGYGIFQFQNCHLDFLYIFYLFAENFYFLSEIFCFFTCFKCVCK